MCDRLDLVEADHDALDCARRNLDDPRARFHWADATTWTPETRPDAVVTNPPFHVGRAADPSLGRAFIAAAARILAPSGSLWLVANRHLPYEATLTDHFARIERDRRGRPVQDCCTPRVPCGPGKTARGAERRNAGAQTRQEVPPCPFPSPARPRSSPVPPTASASPSAAIFAEKGANVMFADMPTRRPWSRSWASRPRTATIRYFAGDLRERLTIANLLSATLDAFDEVEHPGQRRAPGCALGSARSR